MLPGFLFGPISITFADCFAIFWKESEQASYLIIGYYLEPVDELERVEKLIKIG